MRFYYTDREVDPLPGVPGSDHEWEPLIVVRVGGPERDYLVQGLVDTGSALTIVPMRYFAALGASSLGTIRITSGKVVSSVRLARVDLELRSTSTPHQPGHRWNALVGFDPRRDRALWGQTGFLEHFLASFNTHRRFLTLRPNWTFPDPEYAG